MLRPPIAWPASDGAVGVRDEHIAAAEFGNGSATGKPAVKARVTAPALAGQVCARHVPGWSGFLIVYWHIHSRVTATIRPGIVKLAFCRLAHKPDAV